MKKKKIIYGIEEWIINLSENLGADGSFVSIRCRSSAISSDCVFIDDFPVVINTIQIIPTREDTSKEPKMINSVALFIQKEKFY